MSTSSGYMAYYRLSLVHLPFCGSFVPTFWRQLCPNFECKRICCQLWFFTLCFFNIMDHPVQFGYPFSQTGKICKMTGFNLNIEEILRTGAYNFGVWDWFSAERCVARESDGPRHSPEASPEASYRPRPKPPPPTARPSHLKHFVVPPQLTQRFITHLLYLKLGKFYKSSKSF